MKDMNAAKDLFLKYGGSFFYMDREGEYEKYRRFKVSKEQESKWMDAYQEVLLSHVRNDDIVSNEYHRLFQALSLSKNTKYIKLMLEEVKRKIDNVDTFTQLLLCERIMKLINDYKSRYIAEKYHFVIDTASFVIDILSKTISKPITVATYYHNLVHLEDVLSEEVIIARIKRALKTAEEKRADEIKIRSLHT